MLRKQLISILYTLNNLPFFILLLFLTSPCDGQVNFDKVVPPETSRPVTFEDYLVQQAWTNSQEKEKNRTEMAIAKKEVEIARKEWMDQVQMGFNLNEISLGNAFDSGENPTDNIVVYPLYTFNASVSLGTLYNNKKKREIKEFEVKLQELDERQQKLYLRREVLSRYQILLLAEKVLDTHILAEEDSKNTRDISAERFKTGEIKLEDMTKASESYYQALENRMTAETDLEIAKIDLEQLLGIQWSFAVKMRQRIKNR